MRAATLAVSMLAMSGCAQVHFASDDAGTVAVVDAPVVDAPPRDAGPCGAGPFRLEGTPIDWRLGPQAAAVWWASGSWFPGLARLAPGREWVDMWPVSGLPTELDGTPFRPEVLAVAPSGDTLSLLQPLEASRSFWALVVDAGGRARGPATRVDVTSDLATPLDALGSWTGDGWTIVGLSPPDADDVHCVVVDLDVNGVLREVFAAEPPLPGRPVVVFAGDPEWARWNGILLERGAGGWDVSNQFDASTRGLTWSPLWTTVRRVRHVGRGPGRVFWALAEDPSGAIATLHRIDLDAWTFEAQPLGPTVGLVGAVEVAFAARDRDTIGLLAAGATGTRFLLVRWGEGVVEDLLLPAMGPPSPPWLETTETGFVVAWASVLDELVPCE